MGSARASWKYMVMMPRSLPGKASFLAIRLRQRSNASLSRPPLIFFSSRFLSFSWVGFFVCSCWGMPFDYLSAQVSYHPTRLYRKNQTRSLAQLWGLSSMGISMRRYKGGFITGNSCSFSATPYGTTLLIKATVVPKADV